MIGIQTTGRLPGVVISAVMHEGLSVHVDGKPARLAVVLDDGTVVAAGPEVAREAEAVAHNCLKRTWQGQGHLRIVSNPLPVMPGGTLRSRDEVA